jgi:hypothetical protein
LWEQDVDLLLGRHCRYILLPAAYFSFDCILHGET